MPREHAHCAGINGNRGLQRTSILNRLSRAQCPISHYLLDKATLSMVPDSASVTLYMYGSRLCSLDIERKHWDQCRYLVGQIYQLIYRCTNKCKGLWYGMNISTQSLRDNTHSLSTDALPAGSLKTTSHFFIVLCQDACITCGYVHNV